MRDIKGYWFAPLNSERFDAILTVTSDQYRLTVDGVTRHSGQFTDLDISDRTGSISRRITFSDDSLFETQDNDGIDEVLAGSAHKASKASVLHRLESSLPWVFVALIVTAGAAFSFFKWGLPAVSGSIARSLPVAVHENVAAGSMELLDRFWLEETELSEQEQADIQARFKNLISHIDQEDFNFRLYFRRMGGLANAFALPSGEIVVTDGLARLVDPPEELDAVLMHEIGHVLERHGMQHVIQASTVALIASLAIGDVSGSGELIAGVPAFLLQSNYSRKSEASADAFAFRELARQGIDPAHFATVILKLQASATTLPKKAPDQKTEDDAENADYLSTHPDSQLRAKR
ncbi:MAG: M48 family metallopeptidase, partial [Granulosicoccus sp.]|nr:M48 family metallopeptidase [Granulosicoccus sp.]